jgi:carbamoyltransferase
MTVSSITSGSAARPSILHGHATTWHDGAVALLLPDGDIVSLAAERVGDRFKHSWDSRLAYDFLKAHPGYAGYFEQLADRLVDTSAGLQNDHHHTYHAASTFFGSGFARAAVLVMDGQGPQGGHLATTTIWHGIDRDLRLLMNLYPAKGHFAAQSIGHFYTAVGALAGMRGLYDEGKTMALAAYGRQSAFVEHFHRYAWSNEDGTYHIDPRFTLAVLANTLGRDFYGWDRPPPGTQDIWWELVELRGGAPGDARRSVSQVDMDIAFAGQVVLEEIALGLARYAHGVTGGEKSLCLAGGVALNCVANDRIARAGPFDRVFVVPAPSDEGQAIGKLLLEINERALPVDTAMVTPYFGPVYSEADVSAAIQDASGALACETPPFQDLLSEAARRIAAGQVLGWWQGRSELGPRALGHRSILADPRRREMRRRINTEVKNREWFRPLAPIVTAERAAEFFDIDVPSPFMARAVPVRPERRAQIPAVVHVDGSARVQTLSRAQDARCHALLRAVEAVTGIPILLNTSFNRREEPLVETPRDAVNAFLGMPLDALVLGDRLVTKR